MIHSLKSAQQLFPRSDIELMDPVDTTYLDPIFLSNGRLNLLPAAEFLQYPINHLRQWAKRNSRYLIVTKELVDWVKERIGGRSAIEIGAGQGDLGRHVGITMTDSCVQDRPEMRALYRTMDNPVTLPPPEVMRRNAAKAVEKYRPKVVVGAFVTQKHVAGDAEAKIGSSVYGIDELDMMKRIETYIYIGNEITHAGKRLCEQPHETFKFPWLVTRCRNQGENVIWIWNKG